MIIDVHAHYEPGILDLDGIIRKMDQRGINKTVLISRVTDPPMYKKPGILMGIQRFIMRKSYLRPIAKILDDSFHGTKGEWNPWYRRVTGKQGMFKILQEPDNQSVAEAIRRYPDRFLGWIFVNPMNDSWVQEIDRWSKEPGMIGVKVHPFWHRYSVSKLDQVAEKVQSLGKPLLMHLGFDNIKAIAEFCARFPELKVIFGHAGVPFYWDIWPIIKRNPHKYVDLSSHHVDQGIIAKVVDALGPERCLFGTDDPYGESDAGRTIIRWISEMPLSLEDKEKVFSKNFIRIIGRYS
jgi:predicted TIM-barrel fold metal-dependent hydrolase